MLSDQRLEWWENGERKYGVFKELQAAAEEGRIDLNKNVRIAQYGTQVTRENIGILALQIPIDFPEFVNQRLNSPITVFSGANNSGKSYLLRTLWAQIGEKAYFAGCNRFYHVPRLSVGTEVQWSDIFNSTRSQFNTSNLNPEFNQLNLDEGGASDLE